MGGEKEKGQRSCAKQIGTIQRLAVDGRHISNSGMRQRINGSAPGPGFPFERGLLSTHTPLFSVGWLWLPPFRLFRFPPF